MVSDGWLYEQPDWRLLVLAQGDPTDASARDYDDSAWTVADAAFGGGPGPHPYYPDATTVIPKDSTCWVRREVETGGTSEVRVDGTIEVWFDGILLLNDPSEPSTWPGGRKVIPVEIPYAGIIAIRFSDDPSDPSGDWTYFDMAVPVEVPVVRQYPRDDEHGFGAGPRLYPPPRADRVVGGFQ